MKNQEYELIVVQNHRDLPAGIEMVLYGPPYYGEPIEISVIEFKEKHGFWPEKIYQIGKQIYIVLEEK